MLTCFHNRQQQQQQQQQGTKQSLCVFPAKAGNTHKKIVSTRHLLGEGQALT